MRASDAQRIRDNDKIIAELGIVDRPPLRSKYKVHEKAKFGGKKKKASNSGNVGRAFRARQRSLVPRGR